MNELQQACDNAVRIITEKYGIPFAEGRHRIVFRDGNEVIKCPTKESGIAANDLEINTEGKYYAKTREDKELSALTGLPIVRMEWVEHTGWSEKADWTWRIDCGQVGRNANGDIVAYDWEHY